VSQHEAQHKFIARIRSRRLRELGYIEHLNNTHEVGWDTSKVASQQHVEEHYEAGWLVKR